tara:strand:- start:2531 stop:2692 length:162 start_codon:yes stop_codon:yes gene_type:complete
MSKGAPINRVGETKGDGGRGNSDAIRLSPHVGVVTTAPASSAHVSARQAHERV